MKLLLPFLCCLIVSSLNAQDDLLDLLEEETGPEYVTASFKATRVINSHSLENTKHGVLDFRIGHRFGFVNAGFDEFFGFDQATIRLGFDYGVTDRIMVGVGRSSFRKTVDGFAKYKFLKQCKSGCGMPITAAVTAGMMMNTLPWADPERENYFTSRLDYNFQLIVGRKFSDNFTLQLMPGVLHRNLVRTSVERNDVINMGVGGRMKLTKRLALTGEYFYVPPDQLDERYTNSLSIGIDIETGGHVFQLQFTNSTGMFEKAFITETVGQWEKGDIHFGFNISRVFTLHSKNTKSLEGEW